MSDMEMVEGVIEQFKKHKFIETPLTDEEQKKADILCDLYYYGLQKRLDRTINRKYKYKENKIARLIKFKDALLYLFTEGIPLARHANAIEIDMWSMYRRLKIIDEIIDF